MRICKRCGISELDTKWVTYKKRNSGLLCLSCEALRKSEYRKNNLVKARLANNKSTKAWQKANASRVCAKIVCYKLSISNRAPGWLTADQKLEIQQYYKIAKDLSMLHALKYHVDHIIPLKGRLVSGLHVPWNLRVIPASVNLVKSNKFMV